jgi:hypothetical protein
VPPHPVIWCLARGLLKTVPRELLAAGKPLYTFDHPANAAIAEAGAARIVPAADWKRIVASPPPTP